MEPSRTAVAAATRALAALAFVAGCSSYGLDAGPVAPSGAEVRIARFATDVGATDGSPFRAPKADAGQQKVIDAGAGSGARGDFGADPGQEGSPPGADAAEGVKGDVTVPSALDGSRGPDTKVGAGDGEAGAPTDSGMDSYAGANPDADAVPTCDLQACTADSDCGAAPGPCDEVACETGCCVVHAKPAGGACDDDNACSVSDKCTAGLCVGKAKVCDDGTDCTTDSCTAGSGACAHALQAGSCLIDGACWNDGAAQPAKPCAVCKSKASTTAWTPKPACCTADSACPAPGTCDLPNCDVATGVCGLKKKAGCCTKAVDCDDGNKCTTDSCTVATGTCTIVAKTCPASLPCQQATCDPAVGACGLAVKPGSCLIAGACYVAGDSAATNECALCVPAKSPTQWSADPGAFCDDGEACTYDDACSATKACAGAPKPGCCLSDADCDAPGACKTAACNVAQHVCTVTDNPGCCTAGTCCNVATQTVKPAKTACGDAVLATEYKCEGAKVMQRVTTPGCTGTGPDACSPTTAAVGAWTTVKSCAANTVCTATGSGQLPACVAVGPTGTCDGACGGQAKDGTCWCDAACTASKDCCKGFAAQCGCTSGECCDVAKTYPKSAGTACGAATTQWQCASTALQSRTGTASCDGKNACNGAVVWSMWTTVKTCGPGTLCAATATGGECKVPPSGTCLGKCGGQGLGACWCDALCLKIGDCCSDYLKSGCAPCGHDKANSCKGTCADQGAGGCWCDAACDTFGDCCPDKYGCGC
ncbi:MAG: hypothetical protein EXR79_04140 [Myxococcales bacterium]|nr:hypothetical protein [Myxococcales bacterium]